MIKNFVGLTHKIATRTCNLILIIAVFVVTASTAYSQAPTVNAPTVTSITTTDATLGGTVTGTLTHRGTRWSTTSPVGTSNELEEASATAGAFTQARTGLPSAARIFFVAYARNNADVGTTAETTFFTEPIQLTAGQFTAAAISESAIDLTFPTADSWEGTGATGGYVVFRNSGSAPSLGTLADGAAPPADGVGDKIATITNGAITVFNNTGLTAETEYFYTIVPFVWDGASATTYNYNLASPQSANDFTFSTTPDNHPTNGTFTVTGVSSTQINLAFDNPTGLGNSDGYIILRRQDGTDPTTANIQDGVDPTALAALLPAGTTLAGTTTNATFTDTGLTPATQYRYLVLPYNSNASLSDGTYNYKTGGTPVTPKSDYTFATEPSGHATGTLTVTSVSDTQLNLIFNSVTTSTIINATGYIVLIKSSAIVAADLAGLTDGAAPNSFGLFEAIINSTSTNTYNDVSGLAANTTYHYAIVPYNRGSDDQTYNYLTTTGFPTGNGTTLSSQESDIHFPNTGTTNAIAYRSFQSGSITNQASCESLANFVIRDGGSDLTDADTRTTDVLSITMSITNHANLRQIALFNGSTEIPGTEQTVSGNSVTFTPSSAIIVPDNGSVTITVRATFQQTVTDNQQIHVAVTNVTSATGNSGFAASNGGGPTTTGTTNVITVNASKFIFTVFPITSPVSTPFTVVVRAVDSNPYNNIDLNYNGQISLSKISGPAGALSVGGGESLTPILSAGQYTWNTLQINAAGTYGLEASDDAYGDNIGDASSSVTITSSPSTISIPSALNICYGGDAQNLGNIVITETDQSGFSSSGNFTLALPTGFVFDQTVTTAPSSTGAGITISTLTYPSSSVVEFTITLIAAAATSTNSITIGGLRIRHPHPGTQSPANAGGTITRAGGTATIAGVISGTTLGNVNATETGPAVDFTVVKINSGDVDVEASETRFSQNSNPVRLVGSPAGGGTGTEFSGSGVTLVGVQYRFNPQSLSPGTYPITFKYKDAAGAKCEKVVIKNFEVYTTNITNLNAQYCNNDPQTLPMNVDAYLAAFYPTYTLDKFVYWDPTTFAEVDITNPMNDVFDPKLPEYQELYSNTGTYYGVIGIWIGFVISEPPLKLIKRTIWQLIPVRPAPKPSFALPGDDYEFCDDEAPVRLTGSPANSNSTSNDLFTAGNGQSTSIPIPSASPAEWFFIPSNVTGVTVGTTTEIPVTYTYRDPSTGCTGISEPKIIKVNKRPEVILANDIISEGGNNPQICQGEDIPVFVANPDPNITYYWYNNITLTELLASGPSFQPAIDKNLPGITNFYVTKASAGCESAGANISVAVRNLPKIDFTWQNVCLDQTAGFSTTNFNAIENSTPTLTGLVYTWDFNLNNTLTHNNDDLEYEEILISNPVVNYTTAGSDIVKLIVNTPFDCRDTVSKPVYIVPKVTDPIAVSTPYTQDFNTDAAGWIAGGTNSSWEWGTFLKKGTEANPTRGRGWETTLNGDNNQEEQSWVLSNCFDIASTKPVISLDIFSDTPLGVNGVVLQANTNGNIANDASWITIGAVNSGINWYDATGIASRPGNQASVGLGWSGNALTRPNKYETWTTAIFNLDPLAGASNVVFRLAFAADKAQSDGFAFDNVFIGERTRVVMMENFTNNSVTGTPTVSYHNNLYRDLGVAGSEVVKVQYHTPFPGDDPINALNPQINNARTAFYGITEAPTMRIDGRARTGNVDTWLNSLYDERVLTPSPIEIIPTVTKVNGEVIISTDIINRTGQTLPLQGAHVFTTIVQRSVTEAALLSGTTNNEFVFVARQMLPSPTGVIIENNIAASDTYTVPDVVWRFNSGDAIVITVQETGGSKEVYQSHVVLTTPQPDLVTAIEDLAEYITIYPNPANESFEIELPTKAENRLMVNLIDPVGRAAQQFYFEKGEQTKTVNTQNLAQGIYVVQIGSGKTGVVRKKVMIVH